MFLNLENLSKIFPGRDGGAAVRAVDQVSLQIQQGEFITLLGPSGCGKTTTLRLVAGFEFPTEGRIVLDGEEINDQPPNQRDMAMVFQSYAIFPHLNVFENIAYGLKIKRLNRAQIRAEVARVLEMTELNGLENRAPNQLSGGQQQRVALARALVMEPKVLLFDEPLSNLDAKLRVQMRTEIRRIQQSLGITSIYVTHDQDEAMALSDRIVIMNHGRIQQVDTAIEIYRRPSNTFVADFIGQANFIPVDIVSESAGHFAVRIGEVTLQVPRTNRHPLTVGEGAQLLLRPESVRILTAPGPETIPGVVHFLAYLGSVAEYELRIDGHVIAVKHYDPRVDELHQVGEEIHVAFVEENLFLLPNG